MSQVEPEPTQPVPLDPERESEQVGGVDITLIRWMLSLTPAERLQAAQKAIRAIPHLSELDPDKDWKHIRREIQRGLRSLRDESI